MHVVASGTARLRHGSALSLRRRMMPASSLVGVIVSHLIVLFDFIEEMHEKGEPLIQECQFF